MTSYQERSSRAGRNREDIYMRSEQRRGGRGAKAARDIGIRRHREASRNALRDVERSHDIMKVTSVAHRFLAPGVVVRAYFPYVENGSKGKYRPAVVVSKHGQLVTLIALTTSKRATHVTDVPVLDLDAAGLPKASRARTARPECVDRAKVIEVLGRLSARDFTRILMMRSAA